LIPINTGLPSGCYVIPARFSWQDETNQHEVSAMAPDGFSSRILQFAAIAFLVAAGCLFLPLQSSAREGLTGCTVTVKKPNWKYSISLIVPENTKCKVYIWDEWEKDPGWSYKWMKYPSHNPVVDEPAFDLINDDTFSDWKVQARCNGRTFEMKCTRK
jgi:hypothetical protein